MSLITSVPNPETPPVESSWPAMKPLGAAGAAAQPFPTHLIPESVRSWVVDTAERLGAPVAAIWAPVIAGFGSLIGRTRRIYPRAINKGWFEIATFWTLLIARPGSKKSQALKQAVRPLLEMEDEIAHAFKAESPARQARLKTLEIRITAAEKRLEQAALKGEDSKIHEEQQVLEGLIKEEAQIQKSAYRLMVTDTTIEKLQVLLQENPKGIFFQRDEFDGQLQKMDTIGRENDRTFLLEGYDADGQYNVDRMSRESVRITPTVAIAGTIQPEIVAPLIKKAVDTGGGDGFVSRFQLPVLWDLDDVSEGRTG